MLSFNKAEAVLQIVLLPDTAWGVFERTMADNLPLLAPRSPDYERRAMIAAFMHAARNAGLAVTSALWRGVHLHAFGKIFLCERVGHPGAVTVAESRKRKVEPDCRSCAGCLALLADVRFHFGMKVGKLRIWYPMECGGLPIETGFDQMVATDDRQN